jgi:hypothetical protein
MMGWVHASVGAAIGSRIKHRGAAFAAGIVSHMFCDLFPHRDYDLPVEAALVGVTLAVIGARCGARSSEMAGALGAIAPDVENGLEHFGLVSDMVFPTHTTKSWFIGHGRKIESPITQVLLACTCLAVAGLGRRKN